MTSQKSTNNKSICLLSLAREDLRHKTWMMALSILGSMLAGPIAFLFYYSGNHGYAARQIIIKNDKVFYPDGRPLGMMAAQYYSKKLASCLDYLQSYHLPLMVIIAFVGALIVGLFGFRYLYHKNMVDLYHSAPVSRRKLFTTIWLNGLLLWAIPALVASFLVFIEASVYMQGMFVATIFVTVFKIFLQIAAIFLMVYHATLVPVMLSGNVINAIVGTLSYGFLAVSVGILTLIMQHAFYEHFYLPDNLTYFHPLYVLSPLYTPIVLTYQWVTDNLPASIWGSHLIGGLVIMIINLIAAYLLYQKRASELSERGLESKGVRTFMRFCISMLGGAACTMLLYATTDGNIAWMLFGCFFGSALVFCVLNVIYHGSFKNVFSHKLQYGIVFAVTAFWLATIYFDWTGYDKLLPSKSDIKGISLFCAMLSDQDSHYRLKDGRFSDYRRDYDEPESSFTFTDQETIHALLEACVRPQDTESYGGYYLTMRIDTKWGTYYRQYVLDEDKLSLLTPIVESEGYLTSYYPVRSLAFGYPNSVSLVSSFSAPETITDEGRVKALLDCMNQDFKEHGTIKDLLRSSRVFSLNLNYGQYGNTRLFSYDIPYWYEHTIALVESWYPNKKWDPTPDDVASFTLCDTTPVPEGMTIREAVLYHYGYDANEKPMTTAPSTPSQEDERTLPRANWRIAMTDTKFLEALYPYLIWGSYEDHLTLEYTQIGWAELTTGGTVYCYVRYGKLPLEILSMIPQNADIDAPYVYDYDYPATYEYETHYYDPGFYD